MDTEKIIQSYLEGKSMNAIATEFHTYSTTIRRILNKHGIELRHDTRNEGELYVKDGEKLIEWAKSQKRLVTKKELAQVIGRKKLSPSYFIKYPELGQYVKTRQQKSLEGYNHKLYDWLKRNEIPYKPKDRVTLNGLSVDALLLGEYSNLAIQISEKAPNVSVRIHENNMKSKLERANQIGLRIIFLNKDHFENLDEIKLLLDSLKN